MFSLVHQRFDKRVFSCFWKIAEIPEKSIKIFFYVVFRGIGHMPIGRYLHAWLFTYDSIVLSHVSSKNDLLSKDAKLPTLTPQIEILVTSLPRTVTAFKAGPRFHGKRHIKLFLLIFRGFQRFFKNSWKPVYRTVDGLLPLMVGRENMWKEIRIADRRKNGKFQIGLAGLGIAPIAQTFFYQRGSVCLIWSIKTEIGRLESRLTSLDQVGSI